MRPLTKALIVLMLVAAAWLAGAAAAPAQREGALQADDPRTLEVVAIVEDFLEQLGAVKQRGEEQLDAAFTDILEGSNIAGDKKQVAQLRERTKQSINAYGDFVEMEPVSVQKRGTSLLLLRYLYKCEHLPLVWYFTYYRPTEDAPWRLVILRFDTDWESLMRQQ